MGLTIQDKLQLVLPQDSAFVYRFSRLQQLSPSDQPPARRETCEEAGVKKRLVGQK